MGITPFEELAQLGAEPPISSDDSVLALPGAGESAPTRSNLPVERSDEAGTAPGDRRFRPDVQGLRAIAILLVVLFHAGVPRLTGGFVGVDVFFVISGFVITGLLLREQSATGKARLLSFYGRRSRRILPAATLVILVTIGASYHWLGFLVGNETARTGIAASLFYANFHFISTGTNYLASTQPPSALQNYWSLSVEEQFYLVYPTLFILAAVTWRSVSMNLKLTVFLVCGILASLAWSIHQTASNSVAAFFSPFTRGWELALGALIAVGSTQLTRLPRSIATAMTWVGLGGILVAAFTFTATTPYPGSAAVLPVMSTALVLAGGRTHPKWGGEALLRLAPFDWLGRLSYSLYLWHWPILIIAAQHAGHPLSLQDNLLLLLLALGLSIASYYAIENPIRHARFLRGSGGRSIAMGTVLIGLALVVARYEIVDHSAPNATASSAAPASAAAPAVPVSQVLRAVQSAQTIQSVPSNLEPSLDDTNDFPSAGPYFGDTKCQRPVPNSAGVPPAGFGECVYGDLHSSRLMVVYGDSHAQMWAEALEIIAARAGWKLQTFYLDGCPAPDLNFISFQTDAPNTQCSEFHKIAPAAIKALHPSLVVVSSESSQQVARGIYATSNQWQSGLTTMFASLSEPGTALTMIGDIPQWPGDDADCLAANMDNVQNCAVPTAEALSTNLQAEEAAATRAGARYISATPVVCATKCEPIINNIRVYYDEYHLTNVYVQYLSGPLEQALDLPST